MHMFENNHIDQDKKALAWAGKRFKFDKAEVLSEAPWATTYRLDGKGQSAYLKLLPAHQAGVTTRTAALARHFEHSTPTVLAHDDSNGWLLSADHGGETMDYDSPDAELTLMARTYAQLQAQAAAQPALLAGFARPDLVALPRQLLAFLSPAAVANPVGPVQAEFFLGAQGAAHAHRLLLGCTELLQDFIRPALELAPTVVHGDLRPPNAAVVRTDDGKRCVLFDWDDAVVGPAGMSLHGLFEGCTRPIALLSGSAMAKAAAHTPAAKTLNAYVTALAQGGYASRATLKRLLPASICAGMIQFILSFARFPGGSTDDDIRVTLRDRITDLLDLCDLLASREPALARQRAAAYEASGDLRRAQGLLQDLAARNPTDVDLLMRLGRVSQQQDETDMATMVLQEATRIAPKNDVAWLLLGSVQLQKLDLQAAGRSLKRALALKPNCADIQAALARKTDIEAMRKAAAHPKKIPVLRYGAEDAASGQARPEFAALGTEFFNQYGALQIDNAFPVEMIQRLQKVFFERYSAYFQDDNHPDALRVGDKRYMLTVDIKEPFDDPRLLGPATVLPMIQQILGDECVLGAFTAVISLPGSRDQRIHKDHPALFPDTESHFSVPSFTAQIIIPLVELDANTGTTRVFKGSHKVHTEDCERLGYQDPVVPLGSCLLIDYRCAHRGIGNRSQQVRPILTLIFNRPWFHDYANYGKQPPLRLDSAAFEAMPGHVKPLLAWWKEEQAVARLDQAALR
jgi:tetratricopeptide (TPR) repeat protein